MKNAIGRIVNGKEVCGQRVETFQKGKIHYGKMRITAVKIGDKWVDYNHQRGLGYFTGFAGCGFFFSRKKLVRNLLNADVDSFWEGIKMATQHFEKHNLWQNKGEER